MMKYETYKPSEVQLLGDIPSHWEVKRNKDFCLIKGRIGFRGYTKNDFVDAGNGALVIGATELNENGYINVINPQYISWFKYYESPEIILETNDILVVQRGSVGKVAIVDEGHKAATINPSLVILKKIKIHNKFLFYYLMSASVQGFIKAQTATTAIPMISQDQIGKYEICVPTAEEQTTIAQYLDAKTQAIDKKINLLTKKADTYKELRKSIINDAVCKGLDKNVKLKESENVFPVNENWKRYRLKDLGFLYSGLSGKAGDDFNQDDNPNNKGFIPFTNIANNTYLKANHLGTVVLAENEKQNKVRKGDLFFLMSSEGYEDVGKTAALAEDIKDTYLNSFCKGYRITKRFCEPYFLNYLLLSDNYRKSLITEGKGFTRINLKMEKVTDFFVYLPPTKEEQTAIANYLDKKTQKIDAIVSNIGKQIETLKELRKTLINDVVTGKIKVVNN